MAEYVTAVSKTMTFDAEHLGQVQITIETKKRTHVGEYFQASFDDLPEHVKEVLREWVEPRSRDEANR